MNSTHTYVFYVSNERMLNTVNNIERALIFMTQINLHSIYLYFSKAHLDFISISSS